MIIFRNHETHHSLVVIRDKHRVYVRHSHLTRFTGQLTTHTGYVWAQVVSPPVLVQQQISSYSAPI